MVKVYNLNRTMGQISRKKEKKNKETKFTNYNADCRDWTETTKELCNNYNNCLTREQIINCLSHNSTNLS